MMEPEMETLKKTCLYDSHIALGAQMSPFGGYMMPIQYSDIVQEHNAVRMHCGMFDVSHMGEIFISGPDAGAFVNHIFTNDVAKLRPGQAQYGMMLYPEGGVVDDLLVYMMPQPETWLLVVNAANIAKDDGWIRSAASGWNVTVDNRSEEYGQIALQGPESEKIAVRALGIELSDLVFYTFKEVRFADGAVIASRSGYTGEDGFEFYSSPDIIRKIWDALLAAGVTPCGLGCRDTLRFEVGLPLYGHELGPDISPIEAGLGIFVKCDKPEFIGRDAVMALKASGPLRKLVGIELEDKAIPRSGYPVEADGRQIGEVTTGYSSISTGKSVCMAFVETPFAAAGTQLGIRIRKKVFPGKVCGKRFYDKKYRK